MAQSMATTANSPVGKPVRKSHPMLLFVLKRLVMLIPTVLIMSLLIFFIIQLPPGDYLTSYVAGLKSEGVVVDASVLANLEEQFGLDQPWYIQYFKWIVNILTKFDFGYSFDLGKRVWPIIADLLPMTLLVSLVTMLFQYLVSIPLGIYSAVKQYSVGDYVLTTIGFLGMAIPNFLFAILLMYFSFVWTGSAMIGLFSKEMLQNGVHWYNLGEFLTRLLIPVIVIGTSGMCGTLRAMRAQMLDELGRQYVLCARAKGVSERTIIYKYCLRAAINPTVSGLSGSLASIFSGSTISAIVMNLEIIGPTLYNALLAQDMYLAGTILLVMGVLIVVGTLLSDIALAWLDPRIRFSGRSE
ncbi:MAG: ABC transporter permease [Eubacteriales bacterium]|nr:ABC transporter permease [Eubacteriales bacterium]